MPFLQRFANLPAGPSRFLGIAVILLVGMIDYVTGPSVAFSIYYILPIAFITWSGGARFGLIGALFALALRLWSDLIWWGDLSPSLHAFNTLGRLLNFGGIVWLIHILHKAYTSRIRRVEQKYTQIVETAIEGVIAADSFHRITFANTKASSMLGLEQTELLNKNISDFLADEDSKSKIDRILSQTGDREGSAMEVQFRTARGELLWTLVSGSVMNDREPKESEIVLLLTDITEQKNVENTLRKKYREIFAMQELWAVLAQSLDLDTRIEKALRTVLQMTDFDTGALYLFDQTNGTLTLKHAKGLADDTLPAAVRLTRRTIPLGRHDELGMPQFVEDIERSDVTSLIPTPALGSRATLPLMTKEGDLGVLLLMSHEPHAFPEEERIFLQTMGKQISIAIENALLYESARERESMVRRLTVDLVRVQEDERKRFARELHDGLSQTLATIKINSELALRSYASNDELAVRYLEEVILLADEAHVEAKEIAYDLRPAILDDFGLSAALRLQVERVERRTGITTDVHLSPELGRYDSVLETTIYRIVQELLANIVRHSGATKMTLQLLERDSTLALTVSDNGKGFSTEPGAHDLSARQHWGLRNISERVELLEGLIRIESSPGEGTELIVEIPVKARGTLAAEQERVH